MKIAHLCPDEKFIDFIASAFEEVLPEGNDFFIYLQRKNPALRFIKKTTPKRVIAFSRLRKSAPALGKQLSEYDLVIVHYLSRHSSLIVRHIAQDTPLLWSGWGNDYYSLFPAKELYLPLTRAFIEAHEKPGNIFKKIKSRLHHKFSIEWYFGYTLEKLSRDVISKFNYFSAPIYEDYLLVQKNLPGFHAAWLPLNYGSLESLSQTGSQVSKDNSTGRDILLGNSASTTNNHEDAIEILKELDLTGRKVITPLSYGPQQVRSRALEVGKNCLGEHFYPLTDFLPLKEYNKILSSVSIVIMNHLRQEGLGNINVMLYRGAKVFLNKENPVYQFFKTSGAFVFEIKELQEKKESALNPLTPEQIQKNREVLRRFWGQEIVKKNLQTLINTVKADYGR